MKEGDHCPWCMKYIPEDVGILEGIVGVEPYSDAHLMCSVCDSTYVNDQEYIMTKKMSDDQIKALLEMIAPSDNYRGGSISYETAKEWADELIELRFRIKGLEK